MTAMQIYQLDVNFSPLVIAYVLLPWILVLIVVIALISYCVIKKAARKNKTDDDGKSRNTSEDE